MRGSEAVAARLGRLAPDQRAAATAAPGPVLCVAPAGSGKTTTLVARIAWLVDGGADPAAITAVTFNRKAALELGGRLDDALRPLGIEAGSVRVRTFHALGREILRDAGVDVDALVDRLDVLSEVLGRPPGTAELRRLDDLFSRLKLDPRAASAAADDGPADAQRRSDLAMFEAYEGWLARRGALDFDDLVRRALSALREDAALLEQWRARCRPLLVDEVQDLDRSQLALALLLAAPGNDLFLVGDDDQTIYAWRLADVRRVLGLAAALPGLTRVDLVTNYRCPRPVVDRAVRLIEGNRERFAKRIRARPGATGTLTLAPDPGSATDRARRLLRAWGTGDGTRAVLARTNLELAPVAAVALELGIAYRAADDGLLLDHPALDRVLDRAAEAASGRLGRPGGASPASDALPALAAVAGDGDADERRLARSVLGWAARHPTLAATRAVVTEYRTRRVRLRTDDASLVLATAHGTKGLEFDHVACIGLDDGVFPSARSLAEATDPDRALEEERRLAYVAWTRARRSLTLVYDPCAPSIFLREAFHLGELAS